MINFFASLKSSPAFSLTPLAPLEILSLMEEVPSSILSQRFPALLLPLLLASDDADLTWNDVPLVFGRICP